jgi:gliding motility-associated-like protein
MFSKFVLTDLKKVLLLMLLALPFISSAQSGEKTHEELDAATLQIYNTKAQAFLAAQKTDVKKEVLSIVPSSELDAFIRFLGSQVQYDKRDLVHAIAENNITTKLQLSQYVSQLKARYASYYKEYKKSAAANVLHVGGSKGTAMPFSPGRAPGQPCQNMDFEAQSTFAWVGSYGSNCDPTAVAGFNTIGINSGTGQHTICTGGTDAQVPLITRVMPGGTASLRLGDDGGGGNWAARISQTFQVQASNPYFTYNYAVVLEDVGHVISEQPYFRIRMYDAGGNVIQCASLDVDATNAPGLINAGGIKYRDWTQVVIPLNAYVGTDVTIEFTTADCNNSPPDAGGHDGYAYLDCSCVPPQIFTSSPSICGGTSINVTAPSGLASYSWSGPGIVGANNTQTIAVNAPGTYTVSMLTNTTPPNVPCTFTLDTIIPGNPSNPIAQFISSVVCVGGTTQFTDQSTPASISAWAWDFDNNGVTDNITQNPGHVFPGAGTFPVTLTVTSGVCTDNFTANVTVNPGTAPAINPAGPFCSDAAPVFLSATVVGGTWSGPGITDAATGAFDPALAAVGNNTITYTTVGACGGSTTSTIVINPDPVSAAGPDITICSGSTGNLGTTLTAGYSYSWSPATGLSSTTASDPTVTLTNAGAAPVITTYTVLTTSAAGCTSTDDVIVTVNILATADAGPPQTICAGSDVTLAGTIGGGASSATWGGGNGSYAPNNNSLTAVYTPSAAEVAAGSVTLTLVSNDPAGPCPVATSTMTITINPVATIDAGPDQTICIGTGAALAGSIGGAALSGTWSGGAGAFMPSNTDPAATYTPTAGEEATGSVVLTFTSDDPAGPCSVVSDNITITISPLPVADAGADQTICEGSGATLAGSISGAATSAIWTGGTGTFVPNNTTVNAVYTPSAAEIAAGTVTLTLTTDDPTGPCTFDSDNMVITINPVATVNAGPDQTICIGGSATLAASFGGAANSGAWTGGSGTFSPDAFTTNAVYTPTAAEAAAGTVTLTFTTDDPAGPCSQVSDAMVLTINALPTVAAGASQSVCSGSVITLGGIIGGSATSATWSGGNGTFSPNNNTLNAVYTPSAAEYAAGSVTLVLTTNDPAGPCTFATASVTHNFYQNPVVSFSVDDPDGCPVHCVQFTDLSTLAPTDFIVNWTWTFGDQNVSSLQNPAHCYSNTGLYDVSLTVTSDKGCTTTQSVVQMIEVFAVPVAEFSPAPAFGDVLDPHITMHDQSSSDVYQWYWQFGDGDSLSPNDPDPLHTYPNTVSSTYTVTLYVQNTDGCWDTIAHPVHIGPEFTFFIPNAFTPNGDGINDFFFGSGIGIVDYEILIFDRWGNKIWVGDQISDKWNGIANNGTEAAQQDVYVWKVRLTDIFGKKHSYMGTVTIVK